jgi:membrane protease YdiL (CAAX protease family)
VEARFCAGCGLQLGAAPRCVRCQVELVPGAAFCRACGNPQQEAADVEPATVPIEVGRTELGGLLACYGVAFIGVHGIGFTHDGLPSMALSQTLLAVMVLVALATGAAPAQRGAAPLPAASWLALGTGLLALLGLNLGYHWLLSHGLDLPLVLEEPGPLGLTLLVMVVMPAVFEELGFRRILQPRLGALLGKGQGLVIAALLFALAHSTLLSWPYLFVAGLLFGLVYQLTGRIRMCMLFHGLHNLIVVFIA